MLKDDPLCDAILADFRSATVDARRRAIIDYAAKLTEEPAAMQRSDVEQLRAVGLEDADILAVAEVVGYYAYVNRLADGLGVALESDE